jgi:hypothetical protein
MPFLLRRSTQPPFTAAQIDEANYAFIEHHGDEVCLARLSVHSLAHVCMSSMRPGCRVQDTWDRVATALSTKPRLRCLATQYITDYLAESQPPLVTKYTVPLVSATPLVARSRRVTMANEDPPAGARPQKRPIGDDEFQRPSRRANQ